MNIVPMKVELIDSMGSDLSVVNAARVSFNKESGWEDGKCIFHPGEGECVQCQFSGCCPDKRAKKVGELRERDQKLINYLAKHGHWTPFGHVFLSFRIKAPIFVARQLVKHQVGLCWNEVSRRYVDDEPEYFEMKWRMRPDGSIKQGSGGEVPPDVDLRATAIFWNVVEVSHKAYLELLKLGIAPEQARAVTLLDSSTEWIWSGSLAAFARVCKLRLDPHAQQETREVAEQIQALVPSTLQHSWKALLG